MRQGVNIGRDFTRQLYYARLAEKALPDEDGDKLEERRRKAFNRAVKTVLDAKSLVAAQRTGNRFVWLPS
jgi:hypothetical protein